ncbi:hypothetical protein NDU88_000173 [Pleurodeles waltl]|uniref:Uncharacterized protein n=1 Tax=Pleurodeles waltl TaxID=8319 RepID=A0AAV7Q0G4_PLEWA|nr:hypothetical protein NDU88_000173 [Pleurodeles waltl]
MPWGYFGYLILQPRNIFPGLRNDGWPDGGGIFKSPYSLVGETQSDPRSETTTEGPTAAVKEEMTMPGASHGGDEQEAVGC